MKKAVFGCVLLLYGGLCSADTLYVPGEYSTIQAAVDDCNDGDEVVVADGTYTGVGNANITIPSISMTVRSENGPQSCTITCEGYIYGFVLDDFNGVEPNWIVDGFTILKAGQGVRCVHGNPTIRNCIIKEGFGGIYCKDVNNCEIVNCYFAKNLYGILCDSTSKVSISHCTITSNTWGVEVINNGTSIRDSIIWSNYRENIEDENGTYIVNIEYSAIEGGLEGEGNIDVEPKLTLDGHLTASSPCIDSCLDPNGPNSIIDIDGEDRVINGVLDFGADEFLDSDADGLADWWEIKYFGAIELYSGGDNPDWDPYTNLQEYELHGSDPTVASKVYYADVTNGSDSYDGVAELWDGVHGPKQTIQAAIDTAINTDEIIVAAGTYLENVSFLGKQIEVRSAEPGDWDIVQNTVIDGSSSSPGGWSSCVRFVNGEDRNSTLDGFTLTEGSGCPIGVPDDRVSSSGRGGGRTFGGGIMCYYSSPVIKNCYITENGNGNDPDAGGGIALSGDCEAKIENCIISNNFVRQVGGGVYIKSDEPNEAHSEIINCTIINNDVMYIDPVYGTYQVDCWDTRPTIKNTIIWSGDEGEYYDSQYDVFYTVGSLFISDPCLVSYSLVEYGTVSQGAGVEPAYFDLTAINGNIDGYPFFVNHEPEEGEEPDYHLQLGSPCIDAGDPNTSGVGLWDIDGDWRVMGGRIDIGADETYPTIEVIRPETGDLWSAESFRNIRWGGSNAYENVDIWFWFTDMYGPHWDLIENDIENTGSYEWILPAVDSDDCYLWVLPSEADANAVIEGSGWFSIWPYEAGADVNSVWRTLGGDFDRKGSSKNWGPELGCVKWQFDTGGPVSASVTVGHDGRIHIPSEDGKIYTVDSAGALLWSYDVNSPILASATIGNDGGVYAGTQDGKIFAIDIDGNLRWTADADSFIYSSPAVSDEGVVYVGSEDGKVYAFGEDGSELWEFETGGLGAMSEGAILASPVVDSNGVVYVGSFYDSNLYALDGEDGGVKWVHHFDSNGWPFASPVLNEDEGVLYQTLFRDANLYAIDINDGNLLWATNMSETDSNIFELFYIKHVPELDLGWLYQPETYLYVYNASDSSFSEPAIGPDGIIFVSYDDPYLRAVEPNGTIKWIKQLGMLGGFSLTVGNDGLIYAASDDKLVYVIDPNGEELARFEGEGWLSHPVITEENGLVISDANNRIWKVEFDSCGGSALNPHRVADINGDGVANFLDYGFVAEDWLCCTDQHYYPQYTYEGIGCFYDLHPGDYYDWAYEQYEYFYAGDLNRDFYVDLEDVAIFVNEWLVSY